MGMMQGAEAWDHILWNTANTVHGVFCLELRSPNGERERTMTSRELGYEIEQVIKTPPKDEYHQWQ